jgi:hypothetical protein
MQPAPTPIQPEGFLDGLRWGCILRGALLDIALTVAGSIPLTLWLAGPGALSEDETTAREALDALSSPEALFWGAVLGAQPSWYEAIGMIAMLPAGMLGGFLASMRGDAVA